MIFRAKLIPILIIILMMSTVSKATENDMPYPIAAYTVDGSLSIFFLEEAPILITENDPSDIIWRDYAAPVWSPDGQTLVYQSPQMSADLFHVSLNNATPQPLLAAADFGTILTFTLDSQSVIYATFDEWVDAANPPGFDHGTWQATSIILEQTFLQPDTPHEIIPNSNLANIHDVDLSGGGYICTIYNLEMKESRSIYPAPQLLVDTPYGIVAYDYWGGTLVSPESRLHIGNSSMAVPILGDMAVSQDKKYIAFTVFDNNRIGIINLAEKIIETFDISVQPQAIAWNGGRFIYYSVQIEGDIPIIPDEYWELPQFEFEFCDKHINDVAIYQFDIETGQETLIYSDTQYSIPWMELAPDGLQLYYSAIPNGEEWRNKMIEDDCILGSCTEYLLPNLFRLDTNTLHSELIVERVLKSTINFGYHSN